MKVPPGSWGICTTYMGSVTLFLDCELCNYTQLL